MAGALAPLAVFLGGVAWLAWQGAPDERGFWPVLLAALTAGLLLCRDRARYAETMIAGMAQPVVMLMILAWLLAGALSSAVGAQAASRVLITVRATAAPVCPVERYPPDPACVPRPLSGLVVTANTSDGVVATRGVTRSDGGVILRVRAGATYMIHAWMPGPDDRPAVLPRCDVIGLTVGRRPRNVMLHCDTGIR